MGRGRRCGPRPGLPAVDHRQCRRPGCGRAALGKVHQLHDKHGLEKDLSDAVAPGHSGIVALVSDPGAVEIREALAKANGIVEHAVNDVVAKDIHAIADEVEQS